MNPPELEPLARTAAANQGLDPALVCAIVEQEGGWEPWSIRYEPAFFARYVSPMLASNKIAATEAYARSISWGLMQLMGEVARELGFTDQFLASLCDPATGLAWGCKHFKNKLTEAAGDTAKALLAWNGGGNPNYAAQVLARVPKYNNA